MDFTDTRADLDAGATQRIIQEILGGAKTPRYVRIFTHAKLDVVASHDQGRRVYEEEPYIIAKFALADDAVSRPLSDKDKEDFPKEWDRYEASLAQSKDPDVSLLPACTTAAARELADMGITRISAVIARADEVPEHLQEVVKQALMWEQLNNPETPEEESQ